MEDRVWGIRENERRDPSVEEPCPEFWDCHMQWGWGGGTWFGDLAWPRTIFVIQGILWNCFEPQLPFL